MLSSGIAVHKDAFKDCENLENGKNEFVILTITDTDFKPKSRGNVKIYAASAKGEVALSKGGELDDKGIPHVFNVFCEKLQENNCAYGFIHLPYENKDHVWTSKLIFIHWSSDQCTPVQEKMCYSSTKGDVLQKIKSSQVKLQIQDGGDLTDYRYLIKDLK